MGWLSSPTWVVVSKNETISKGGALKRYSTITNNTTGESVTSLSGVYYPYTTIITTVEEARGMSGAHNLSNSDNTTTQSVPEYQGWGLPNSVGTRISYSSSRSNEAGGWTWRKTTEVFSTVYKGV